MASLFVNKPFLQLPFLLFYLSAHVLTQTLQEALYQFFSVLEVPGSFNLANKQLLIPHEVKSMAKNVIWRHKVVTYSFTKKSFVSANCTF